jgi:hypothetical protein
MKKIILIIAIIALLAAPALAFPPTPPGSGGGTSLPSQTGNNGKYLTTDGSNASWGAVSSGGKVCKTITNPSAADTKLWFDIASTRTVTKLWGICTGGTSVEATLKNGGADGTGSTTIAALTGAQIVDTNGASQTTISSASLTDGDMIYLTIGTVTGVVTQVMVCYE